MVLPLMGVLPLNMDNFSMTAGSTILAPIDVWYDFGALGFRILSKNLGAFRSRAIEVVEVDLVNPLSTEVEDPKVGLEV